MTDAPPEDVKIREYAALKMRNSKSNMRKLNMELDVDKQRLDSVVKTKMDEINAQMKSIKQYSAKLNNGPDQIGNQEKVMLEKNNLINSRLLMFENVKRKNSFKMKLVYTTIAIILIVVIIMLSVYIYKNKQYIKKDFNKNVALK